MKKVGINELYEMILEEMGLEERTERQAKEFIKKYGYHPKLKTTLEIFKNQLKTQSVDENSIKKGVLAFLKSRSAITESKVPQETGDAKADEIAKKLAQDIPDNIAPDNLARLVRDIFDLSGETPASSGDDESDAMEVFSKFDMNLKKHLIDTNQNDIYDKALKVAQEVVNIKTGFTSSGQNPAGIITQVHPDKLPNGNPHPKKGENIFDGITQKLLGQLLKAADRFDQKGVEDINAQIDSVLGAASSDAADDDSSDPNQRPFYKAADETISKFADLYKDKDDRIKLNDFKVLKRMLYEVVFKREEPESILTDKIQERELLNQVFENAKEMLTKLAQSSDAPGDEDSTVAQNFTKEQEIEFFDRLDAAIRKIESNLSEVNLPTDSEEELLDHIENEVGTLQVITKRKEKEISFNQFINFAEDNIISKLKIDKNKFTTAANKAFKNDSAEKTLSTSSLENMVSKVVEISKDKGMGDDFDESVKEAGEALINTPSAQLEASGEWNNFFHPLLFPTEKIQELKLKFAQFKNLRDELGRLNTGALKQQSDSVISKLNSQFPQILKDYANNDQEESLDQNQLFDWVNKMSSIIKEYLVGSRRAPSFQNDIKTLADLSENIDDENSVWNLNKKEDDPPDDFFIKFDEQLRNVARLKVWEPDDVKKLGGSIADLGLSLGNDQEEVINTVNEQAEIISSVAKKSKFYKGLESIDQSMSDSIDGRELKGYSKTKAEESFARLKEKFIDRYNKKYDTNYSAPSDDSEDSTIEDTPINPEEGETDKEKELINDINRYSEKEYQKWFDDNNEEINIHTSNGIAEVIDILEELIETVEYSETAPPDSDAEEGESDTPGIEPRVIRENEDFDPESFSEDEASLDKMKEVGISEYLALRIMSSLINEKLYKLISKKEGLEFVTIKEDIKKAFSDLVELIKTLNMKNMETELNEGKFLKRAFFQLMKKIGIPQGQFKAFYVHELIEKSIIPAITNYFSNSDVFSGYTIPKEGKSETPPYPGTPMRKILRDLADILMKIDEDVNPVNERLTSLSLKNLKWSFSKGKFSLVKFFKILSKGGNESARRYNEAMKAFELNKKERANLAWYFSKKGNVEKFIKDYLKDHSQYKYLLRQDVGALGGIWDSIKQMFRIKGYKDGNRPEDRTRPTPQPAGGFDDPGSLNAPALEEALKPIIESIMIEMLNK